MIIDSHAHLDMHQYDSDRESVIQRAMDAGLKMVVTIGTGNPEGSSIEETIDLIEKHDFLYAGIGVHPHDARTANGVYWQRMERWVEHPKVVLWGEIGLDYYYDLSPRETQREVFRRQLKMAGERHLPVSIHCRDAWPDMVEVLKQECRNAEVRGILHSFTGNREQALECVAMGFLVSFSGIVTFKNADSLRDAARAIPMDNVLVETDSPYLAPVPHRGKRNEPAYVIDVAHSLAQTTGVAFEDLARRTTANLLGLLELH